MASKKERPSAKEYRKLPIEGEFGAIRLSPEADAAYKAICTGKDDLSVRRRTALNRYMLEFCANKIPRLNEQHFKKEDTFSVSRGKKVAIFAFKPWKWRLYGAIMTIDGVRTFVGVKVDEDKKQDKANRGLMKSAADAISELEEHDDR
jgi:hypothetical protein